MKLVDVDMFFELKFLLSHNIVKESNFWEVSETKIDQSKIYLMPLMVGPIADPAKRVGSVYGEVQYISL